MGDDRGRVSRPRLSYDAGVRSLVIFALTFALLWGCTFSTSIDPDGSTNPGNEPGMGSEPKPMNCFGTGLGVSACLMQRPTMPFMVAGTVTIDTMTSPACAQEVAAWCVIAAKDITISGTLGAQGMRPLVLIATDTITVSGTIDVASHINTTQDAGPGANAAACTPGVAAVTRGGGWGGSFGTAGGGGGGVTGAMPAPAFAPASLHGGCPGSAGANSGGGGGHGGGAIDLIAEGSISVSGTINASGKSGSSTTNDGAGGGGGGSGGLIVFDTPTLSFAATAIVFANGGGGGEGTAGNTGVDGIDPVGPSFGGVGGGGGTTGGDGGTGGYNTLDGTTGNNGVSANEGGGGGGGGAGVIKLFRGTAPALGLVSPPLS